MDLQQLHLQVANILLISALCWNFWNFFQCSV